MRRYGILAAIVFLAGCQTMPAKSPEPRPIGCREWEGITVKVSATGTVHPVGLCLMSDDNVKWTTGSALSAPPDFNGTGKPTGKPTANFPEPKTAAAPKVADKTGSTEEETSKPKSSE